MVVGPPIPEELQRLRNLRLGKLTAEDLEGYVLTQEELNLLQSQGVSTQESPKWLQNLKLNNTGDRKKTNDTSSTANGKKLDKLFDPNQALNDEVRNEMMKNVSNMSDRFTK